MVLKVLKQKMKIIKYLLNYETSSDIPYRKYIYQEIQLVEGLRDC